jgi:S-methylmethionine-dependent homocysteine/selenocysteine methylase
MKRDDIKIIDGGVGTELQRRGVPMHPDCWCATAHMTDPEMLLGIHRDYIDVGATVISTNTFLARRHILAQCGAVDVAAVNRSAVELAREARDEFANPELLVAGSLSTLPPLEQADEMPRGEQAERDFREQVELLVAAGVDLLLVEMLIDSQSAASILSACCDSGLPVWAGLSAMRSDDDDCLMTYRRPGKFSAMPHETFENLIQTVCEFPVEMLGVMHTDLEVMVPALSEVATQWDGPMLAYAKFGINDEQGWQIDTPVAPEAFADQAMYWAEHFNARLIGGCCGTQPEHIRAIRARLSA